MTTIIMMIIGYLLGSISSATIVCKMMNLPDPRATGSKNAGTTNVLRLGNQKTALIVLLSDMLKGLVAVLLAHWVGLSGLAIGLVAVACIVGHMYPVFFQFKGGKGVATMMGVVFGLSLFVFIAALVTWIITAGITRYASLASLIATALASLLLMMTSGAYILPMLIILALIVYQHRENIDRLRHGNENKLDFSSREE